MEQKFDPNVPEELVLETLDPAYGSDGQRERAKTDPSVVEQGRRAAYGILKNGGARNAEELDKLLKSGWKPAERKAAPAPPPPEGEDEETEGAGE